MPRGDAIARRTGAALILLVAPAAAALAAPAPFTDDRLAYHDVPAMSPDELAGIRGGFVTVNGFNIRFGVEVLAGADGEALLQTVLPGQAAAPLAFSVGNPGGTEIIHQLLGDHHLAILKNQIDSRVIEQILTINIEVTNFRAVTETLAGIDRLAGVMRDPLTISVAR